MQVSRLTIQLRELLDDPTLRFIGAGERQDELHFTSEQEGAEYRLGMFFSQNHDDVTLILWRRVEGMSGFEGHREFDLGDFLEPQLPQILNDKFEIGQKVMHISTEMVGVVNSVFKTARIITVWFDDSGDSYLSGTFDEFVPVKERG